MNRVTADTNIYISAVTRGGKPLQLVEMARAGEIALGISEPILSEVTRVLADKFHWTAEDLAEIRALLAASAQMVSPTEAVDAVTADPTDNRILECAVAAGSDVVVTGDRHLLALGNVRGIDVVTVSDFLLRWPASGH